MGILEFQIFQIQIFRFNWFWISGTKMLTLPIKIVASFVTLGLCSLHFFCTKVDQKVMHSLATLL